MASRRAGIVALLVWANASLALAAGPKTIIVCIGDGMGPLQVQAGGMFAHGAAGTLSFESAPFQGRVTTHSADAAITDSAAGATAIATGHKVNNGVLSLAIPGDGGELTTILEIAQSQGKRVGLLTTTTITHATPAGFGSHAQSRGLTAEIAGDYLTQTRPDLILGGGGEGISPRAAMDAGYTVVTDRASMLDLATSEGLRISGQFGTTQMPFEYDGVGSLPHLSEMTQFALDRLQSSPQGFFLMLEGGRIDHACHSNDIQRCVREMVEFSNAVQKVLDWAQGRNDCLVLVTADHETGGLQIVGNNGVGQAPTVTWSTGGHTATQVGVYGWGVGANRIEQQMDNTEIFQLMAPAPTRAPISPALMDDETPSSGSPPRLSSRFLFHGSPNQVAAAGIPFLSRRR